MNSREKDIENKETAAWQQQLATQNQQDNIAKATTNQQEKK